MKRKERKLFSIQAVLFGRDLLQRQIHTFEKIQASYNEDGFKKTDEE
jgi:phage FluMu protein gp41